LQDRCDLLSAQLRASQQRVDAAEAAACAAAERMHEMESERRGLLQKHRHETGRGSEDAVRACGETRIGLLSDGADVTGAVG
jgi:hypothetical protein